MDEASNSKKSKKLQFTQLYSVSNEIKQKLHKNKNIPIEIEVERKRVK